MAVECERVIYDPRNLDTYPSVCQTPEEVKRRFEFTGGETLLFDLNGNYVGQALEDGRIVKRLDEQTYGPGWPD